MRRLAAALVLTLLASPPSGAATITGKVVLIQNGTPRADASNTVVWIEGVHSGAGGAVRGEMKSSSKHFLPRVLAVSRNSTVDFPNVDPIYHNVFSVSGANRFDLGLYRSGASKSKRFEEPGLVRIYCNIHPQMVGFVMVVDSDLVAVTGPDGSFRFDGVSAGPHSVKAWQEEGAEVGAPVAVPGGGEATVLLRIDVSTFQPEPHKNKYGKDYPPKAGESDDERY